ncbi:hypothetical protein [Kaistella jeonii]|uniref:Uncharacterized protein n=1 Tax=Kaistella jeonii TaxID=266749 RepID=A0A0C1F8Y8_9FLAO|nr:hypothetical protein [Kaistella jeonii]KIA89597.1 hypothetical protein OA86_02895 [Kaistella jeonii]SFB90243.1 hypothetical protein SAMN05421876_103321 [Kaistella jeonii]VEI95806.1 Uncharacterised protein [Kaistella jeonii]
MNEKRQNLVKLLGFIDELSKDHENKWFADQLKSKYNLSKIESKAEQNIQEIRDALQIKGSPSVKYEFVTHNRLRDQLIIDNLRMENAALDLKEKDELERFFNFCVNAFFQIENLINYYYHIKYPNINDLLIHLEQIPGTVFRRNSKRPEKSVADIVIATKIYSFGVSFKDSLNFNSYTLTTLNKIRNEGLHRCKVIERNSSLDLNIFKFFQKEDFSSIRTLLKNLVNKIEEELQIKNNEFELATISSMFPSSGFLRLGNGKTVEIPSKYFSECKKLAVGTKLRVELKVDNGKINIISISTNESTD